ncbi:MAG: BON domain-containing protein [Pyrinomonadaceae bacterium]
MPRKTDSEIEQWVLRELSLSKKVRSTEICVFARDGVVRLRGSVHSYQDRLPIEEATRRASGIVDVVNEMRIKPCAALIERVPTSVALTVSLSRGMLVQTVAIQRPVVKAATA